jgi:hypothetical protein
MTSSRWCAPSGRMTTPNPSPTLLPNIFRRRDRWGQNFIRTFLASVRVTHIWISEPMAAPCNPTSTSMLLVAKSTTTRSGYICATVTISQAAFMQPSKAKERHYSFPFTATYPTARIHHFRCRCPAIPRWNGRNLSYHLKTTWRGRK